jgi:hypothetical protein
VAKRSAGIIMYRRTERGVELLLAHFGGPMWAKKNDGAWAFPKGKSRGAGLECFVPRSLSVSKSAVARLDDASPPQTTRAHNCRDDVWRIVAHFTCGTRGAKSLLLEEGGVCSRQVSWSRPCS